MSGSKFTIPVQYRDLLHYQEPTDKRSDQEVLKSLKDDVPVSGEKNVWAFWDTGISMAPAWCQRNVASWVRINSASGWTVRVLNCVEGSAGYWAKFVPAELLPKMFVQGRMDGPYAAQHSADLLRGALLYLHGGVFIDVSCLLIRSFDRVCWDRMKDSQFGVAHTPIFGDVIQNSFMAARKGNIFMKQWHDLFVTVWSSPEDRTNHKGLLDHPLLQFANHIEMPIPPIGLSVSLAEFKEYITQIVCWRRMCRLSAPDKDSIDFNSYWKEHILPISMTEECWGMESVCGWSSEHAFRRLSDKLEPERTSDPQYTESVKMVWHMLSQCSMQKFFTGKQMLKLPAVGSWLSAPEYAGADCEPGTFVELLRYGAEHFIQSRKEVSLVSLGDIKIMHCGVLEL